MLPFLRGPGGGRLLPTASRSAPCLTVGGLGDSSAQNFPYFGAIWYGREPPFGSLTCGEQIRRGGDQVRVGFDDCGVAVRSRRSQEANTAFGILVNDERRRFIIAVLLNRPRSWIVSMLAHRSPHVTAPKKSRTAIAETTAPRPTQKAVMAATMRLRPIRRMAIRVA